MLMLFKSLLGPKLNILYVFVSTTYRVDVKKLEKLQKTKITRRLPGRLESVKAMRLCLLMLGEITDADHG